MPPKPVESWPPGCSHIQRAPSAEHAKQKGGHLSQYWGTRRRFLNHQIRRKLWTVVYGSGQPGAYVDRLRQDMRNTATGPVTQPLPINIEVATRSSIMRNLRRLPAYPLRPADLNQQDSEKRSVEAAFGPALTFS